MPFAKLSHDKKLLDRAHIIYCSLDYYYKSYNSTVTKWKMIVICGNTGRFWVNNSSHKIIQMYENIINMIFNKIEI